MAIPLRQQIRVGAYILKQRLLGRDKYPLVLMLEPLFRCNLACAGCGKIDYPDEILNKRLSVEECMQAIDECGAPVVSIAGGEPLIHKELPSIVAGFVQRKTAEEVAEFLDMARDLGVEGVTISPGFSYERAPKQEVFLERQASKQLFRDVFKRGQGRKWRFKNSPLYLDFLAGEQRY